MTYINGTMQVYYSYIMAIESGLPSPNNDGLIMSALHSYFDNVSPSSPQLQLNEVLPGLAIHLTEVVHEILNNAASGIVNQKDHSLLGHTLSLIALNYGNIEPYNIFSATTMFEQFLMCSDLDRKTLITVRGLCTELRVLSATDKPGN